MTPVLHDLVEARAAADPDAVCMQEIDGRSLTYRELRDEWQRWAAALHGVGVRAGDRVATMLHSSFGTYATWLGTARLRAIEVPVNTMFRGDMLRYVVRNSTAEVFVVDARFLDVVIEAGLDRETRLVVVGAPPGDLPRGAVRAEDLLDAGAAGPLDLDEPRPRVFDTAAMIYTSGTTGPSKGVLMPWGELHQFAMFLPDDMLAPGETYYAAFPAFHASGKSSLFQAARFGATLLVREKFSPTTFWDEVRTYDVRAAALAGVMCKMLLGRPEEPGDRDVPLANVLMIPLVPEVRAFSERFGVRVATAYGMTEVGVPLATDGFRLADERSCGRCRPGHPGYEVRIVDEHDEPVAPGAVGELIVRTAAPWTMNAGYFGMPDKTAEAWRNGWFHTGDAFSCDDVGNYYFVDRLKDTIRRRGENISSFEVEEAVRAHPDVAEVAAVAVPSELGEDEVKVVVLCHPGADLEPAKLAAFLEERMPRFMVPRYVELADDLPRTDATLRVKKFELRRDPFNERTWDRETGDWVPAAG